MGFAGRLALVAVLVFRRPRCGLPFGLALLTRLLSLLPPLLLTLLLSRLTLGLPLLVFLLPGFLLCRRWLLSLRHRRLHLRARRCLGDPPALLFRLLTRGGLRPRLPLGGGWSPVRAMGCDGGRRGSSRQHGTPRDRTAGRRRHLRFIDLGAEDRDPV